MFATGDEKRKKKKKKNISLRSSKEIALTPCLTNYFFQKMCQF